MFTCPCCGYQTLGRWPGSYDICEICYWEDDAVQLLDPGHRGGANRASLIECQSTFLRIGASKERVIAHVRRPTKDDVRDEKWRLANVADLAHTRTPGEIPEEQYDLIETWYYWLRNAN